MKYSERLLDLIYNFAIPLAVIISIGTCLTGIIAYALVKGHPFIAIMIVFGYVLLTIPDKERL